MRPGSRLFGVRVPRPSTRSHCVARGDRRGVASLDAVYREILGVGGSCVPDVPWDSRLIDRAVDDLARLGRLQPAAHYGEVVLIVAGPTADVVVAA